jgi:glycosyltransferase involved in cell wall biosynthesis
MEVVYFMRHPRQEGLSSVELVFGGVIDHLGGGFRARRAVSRFPSSGILYRVYNVVEAAFRQGDINHVAGDIHFVTYLLNRRKTVLTVLDCGRIGGAPDYRKRIIKLFWFVIPTSLCSAITVISHAVKEDLLRHVHIDPDKIHVIHVAVPSLYSYVPKEFDEDEPVILQIGTAPNKNLPRLFAALSGIRCRLQIVGKLSPEQLRALQESGIRYQNLVGLSNEQMFEQYSKCDIVSFPSTFEGFGMPIIEGNLVGRPVVAGNVASMPEVAGDAACLVDPFDVESIRSGFLRVIHDAAYRKQLVDRGFANAKRFDHAAITAQYEEVYRKVAAAHRPVARCFRRAT